MRYCAREGAVVALNASLEQRITERTVELAEANERLKIQNDERQEAQRALAESLQRQVEFNTLQQELLGAGDLTSKLSRITDAITRICKLDFCRIWITTSCSVPLADCLHAIAENGEYRCRGCTQCLKLLASSGRYPNDNGDPYRHIPFGHRTIGQIATGAEHKFITNSVTTDERIRQHNWARELELVSLAAYQLRPPGGETIGVLAAFSKHETTPEVDAILESVANTATRVILNAKAEEDQHRLQIQLSQSQRLESVGQLASGIAHEINTPTQFVGDNIRFLLGALPKLLGLLAQYQQVVEDCRTSAIDPSKHGTLAEAVKKANLSYLVTEIPQALSDSLEGLDRVTTIIRAMKDFSHPGQNTMALADLNRAIESTVTVARNEWKYFADMQLNLEPGMPPVLCLVGDINQVILNIVVNAAHAIREARGDSGGKGTITVSSRHETGWIEIRIADTGTGIAAEHRDKVFDHFFTTKPVGMGTGQGLSFARRVIVDQHHGSISFETEPGQGTTFIIRLPVVDKGQSESSAARCSMAAVVAG